MVLQTKSNPKCQILTKFLFGKGEGGTLDTTFLKYSSGGTQGILLQKSCKANLLLHRR